MELEKPLSGYKYQVSPKYNNIEYKNFKTPKINLKNETSEMILNQTKESLHNFLINLKNCSFIKDDWENKSNNIKPIITGSSNNSNIKNPEETQSSYESNYTNIFGKQMDNNNNLETNILNYNKIYNTNNVYNLGNNSIARNKPKIRVNKIFEPYQPIQDKLETEANLNLNTYNNLNNLSNVNKGKTDFPIYNTTRRTKYNFSLGKTFNKSENKNNKRKNTLLLNFKEKIKILKTDNERNKKDIINLANAYSEMQKTLLDKIRIMVNEKDNKIKELENKIKEINEEKNKDNNIIEEKNKKLMKDIESLNKEIKKLNKNNEELQKTIKDKDNIISKYNIELKELEDKLQKISNKDIIKYELKEKEEELNSINSETDNKLKSYQELLLEYKQKNDELSKENKTITGLNNILKSQKKSLTKENTTNKQILEELKIENEKLIKERDNYKITKEKLINEIEIIKLNNDRIYNIKSLTNNNTNKLKNEISSLKREKEILGEKNVELQKRIKSLDRKYSQNKTLKVKSKTVANLKRDKFDNLKIIKIKEFTLSINNNNKQNKNLSKKNTPKKSLKKALIKFKKLLIVNKVADICIKKKSGNTNKKIKKKINKFTKLVKCNKIVDIIFKNTPKPTPKPKKKKFLKLKSINGVVNICLKSKINNNKFKSKKLKISSKVNGFDIKSFNTKKKIELKKSNLEYIFFEKSDKKEKIEEIKLNQENKSDNSNEKRIEKDHKEIIYEVNKQENIIFEGKSKSIILDINKIENFSLKEIKKEKLINKNLLIGKIDPIIYVNQSEQKNKIINVFTIDKNSFYLLSKEKVITPYEITTNNLISFSGLNICFNNIVSKKNDSFDIISKQKLKTKILYEISKNEVLSYIKNDKKVSLKVESGRRFFYIGLKFMKNYILKKENTSSLFFKPKRKPVLLSKSANEQVNPNPNKPKIMSFFSSFIKPKKTNTVPMRVLTVQYKKSKKEKISELNKRNKIISQNQFNFLKIEKKKKEIKYEINNTFSFNYEKLNKIPIYNIININSFAIEQTKKKFDLSLINDPKMLEGEENLKQLVTELNKALNLKNEEINRLLQEKADMDLANQLFNDSSNEQIENLSKSLSILKEKNEKLNDEIDNLKDEINNNKYQLEEKRKEFDEKKNNLDKTIEILTKENSQLKLELFKRGTEQNNKSDEKEKEENIIDINKEEEYKKQIETLNEDINKMRQSKIIEVNQLKLELTKSKVEVKRLENKIKKLESENVSKNGGEDNIQTLKINDIAGSGSNKNNNGDEMNKLKSEIENYKNKISEMTIEIKKNEELRHQNILFTQKLQEAQKKLLLANQVITKAKKYSLCLAYMSQFLGLIKPEGEKQVYLVNKLKEFIDENQKEKK